MAAAVLSCRCDKAPGGIAPFAHLADGNMDLMTVRSCTRLQHLLHLMSIPVRGGTYADASRTFVRGLKVSDGCD